MEELINRVATQVGIDESLAKPAVGVVLNMLRSVLPDGIAAQLMSSFAGAEQLATQAQEQAGSGGVTGMLGGALGSVTGGSTGGVMKALGQLQGLGLSSDQAKGVGEQVLGFVRENAPEDVVSAVNEKVSSFGG